MGLINVVGQPTGLSTNGTGLSNHTNVHVGGRLPNPLPHNAATFSSLRDSLVVARSAVEDDAAQVVQVPESQIHDVLDKLRALEDEVSALLDGDGYTATLEDEASDRPHSPEANKDAVPAKQKFVADENEKDQTADDAAEDDSKTGNKPIDAPENNKLQSLPLGGGLFKEDKAQTSAANLTTTMTKTRTTTVTMRPTERKLSKATTPSTAAAAETAAPPILQAPKAKVAAQFKEMVEGEKQQQQQPPRSSTIEAEPSSLSNATVEQDHLAGPGTSSTRVSPVGNKVLDPPTSTSISPVGSTILDPPTSTPGSPSDHILVDPHPTLKAVSETPVPQLVNNKAPVANNFTSTGFQTITRPGTGSKDASA